jgi:hypothetical protein
VSAPVDLALVAVAAEGAVDRLTHRRREDNPYSSEAADCRRAWELGWLEADWRASRMTKRPEAPAVPATRARQRASVVVGDGCSRYGLAALRRHSERVASAHEGTRRNTLNGSAFSLGQLVGSGHLRQDVVRARLRAAASSTGLPAAEIERTIKAGLRDGQQRPYYPREHAA